MGLPLQNKFKKSSRMKMKATEAQRKYQYIEVVLQWEGELTTNKLQDYFDIASRTTASNLIKQYRKDFPENLLPYEHKAKSYQPSKQFKPRYTQGILEEYLSFFGESPGHTYLDLIPTPIRNINTELVRQIIQACRQQKRIDIEYYSLSSGDFEGRIISPHTLVNDGIRWHVRAYCEKNQEHRDFVLSRFAGVAEEEGKAEFTIEQDEDWNKLVTVTLQPDPRLNKERQRAIELDYLMENGKKDIICRASLVKYLLQKLRLDSYHQNPQGQQIIVDSECWENLKPYRMD
jgi:predicted DNA-binding transcriptional regulator YafY